MTLSLTTEQILALAPDSSSAKAGQGLATQRKWVSLGRNTSAVWGECQGSGKNPYQVQVDLSGDLAYRCSCPSRKLPCKHTLGLLLLQANQPASVEQSEPPEWVAEWLAKRAETAQKRAEKHERAVQPVDPAAQAKRAATREARIGAGFQELELWMSDLLRQGLMTAQGQPYSFWDGVAARMVDAQAPGVARMLRDMAGIPASGAGWQGRLLEQLSLLHLLIRGFQRLADLPPDTQEDIRSTIGLNLRETDLATLPALRDHWLVLGQRVENEDTLRVQRTWLWAQTHNRPALILSFAAAGQPLDRSLIPGTTIDAECIFYPSAAPLRAIVKTHHATPQPIKNIPGYESLSEATGAYAAALAANPWLRRWPLALLNATLQRDETTWRACDIHRGALPFAHGFAGDWQILALSGGRPFQLFGEWDGDCLMPVSVYIDGEFRGVQ